MLHILFPYLIEQEEARTILLHPVPCPFCNVRMQAALARALALVLPFNPSLPSLEPQVTTLFFVNYTVSLEEQHKEDKPVIYVQQTEGCCPTVRTNTTSTVSRSRYKL